MEKTNYFYGENIRTYLLFFVRYEFLRLVCFLKWFSHRISQRNSNNTKDLFYFIFFNSYVRNLIIQQFNLCIFSIVIIVAVDLYVITDVSLLYCSKTLNIKNASNLLIVKAL